MGSGAMLKRLREEIYGGVPAEFAALGSPDETAHRLAQGSRRGFARPAVAGRVSVEHVALRRSRLFSGNSFAPVFRGAFTADSGQTVLRGRFQLHPFVQAFVTLWFALIGVFCAIFLILGPSRAAEEGGPWRLGLLVGIVFATGCVLLGLVGFALLRFSKWLSRDDVAEIRHHITDLLEKGAA